jgi:hypothetical protein
MVDSARRASGVRCGGPANADHVGRLHARQPWGGAKVAGLKHREGVEIAIRVRAPEGGAPEQHLHPLGIDEPRHRRPGKAQDVGVAMRGVDAEAPHLGHAAAIGGQPGQFVMPRRVARPDLAPVPQEHEPEAAHELPAPRLLDEDMPAERVERISLAPLRPGRRTRAPEEGEMAQPLGRREILGVGGGADDVTSLGERLHRAPPVLDPAGSALDMRSRHGALKP